MNVRISLLHRQDVEGSLRHGESVLTIDQVNLKSSISKDGTISIDALYDFLEDTRIRKLGALLVEIDHLGSRLCSG